ncbi:bifunctional folylpolyglutamate synthase/dihydrofolate synthase [Youngiibacter multivorans]|uniref:tetrahydrofolate synthase n=1 Tax=Youngiibacter multivorans TaxID=937251 RepID=A0ABS4G720_9CLOT|nr:folylpolyglutamate synthase/dihydrofolate synthase family protein [Youngiibacter multivorans]MBP1920368.1 dihydrofolate synthase/folylpolyglutamate synthase [Youngiibacter multivorans]
MDYIEALKYIHGIPRAPERTGLDRMRSLMRHLGNPQDGLKFIHVAGTNGKGSTSRIISLILEKSGYRTGLYTSPFIEVFEERIQVNSRYISHEALARLTGKVRAAVTDVMAEGHFNPTEFEVVTAIMFLYFKEMDIDFGVIEVGLGGKNDATNVLLPVLSVITSISFDHVEDLGDTIESIAGHKAGIIKKAPSVSAPQDIKAAEVLIERAHGTGSDLTFISGEDIRYIGMDEWKQLIELTVNPWGTIKSHLSLLGKHQLENSLLAVTAVSKLVSLGFYVPHDAVVSALDEVIWPARMERFGKDPVVILDGAHNPDGMRNLIESVDTYFRDVPRVVILGILKDKEAHLMAELASQGAQAVICTSPPTPRALTPGELMAYVPDHIERIAEPSYEKALETAKKISGPSGLILITGSLYMMGEFRKVLRKRENEGLYKY